MEMRKKFDEIFEDCTKLGTKIKTDEYHSNGKHPIIDQGQEMVAGFTDTLIVRFFLVQMVSKSFEAKCLMPITVTCITHLKMRKFQTRGTIGTING